MRRINVQGPVGRISCLCTESETLRPPVVFVHGINGDATQWAEVARRFTDRQVVAVELRGHGDSEPGGDYGATDYAADVSAAMSALGLTRAHLVGASFGGSVCITVAASAPGHVASLSVIGGALSIAATADEEAAAAELRRLGSESFFEHAAATSFGPNATAEMLRESVRSAVNRDPAVIECVLRAALTADVSAAAAKATAPARVMTGEHDQTCPPGLGEALATALDTTCLVLPGLGHMAHIEDPGQIGALLADHFQQVELPSQAPTVRSS